MVVGSPNYLSLSPYQISSPVRKISAPFASHWFLIQVISTIIDISTFGNTKNIHFSSENMVSNGWFRMYLNQAQAQYLIDSTYFKLYPIERKSKLISRKLPEYDNYFVHASNDWTPPEGSRVVYRISDTIYYVEDLIIDEAVRNDPRILSINPSGEIELHNRYTSGFLQSGHQQSYYDHGIFAPIRSLHNIGLNGTGQVINVVDSGVDFFNAFFYDPDPKNSLDSITNKTNKNARKIVRIEAYADNTDLLYGHGTHVAGTAVGSSYCPECGIAQYNGIACGAKLYFGDIGNSTSGENSGRVDLIKQAEIFKELDVHVSSNSWGYSSNEKEIEFSYNKAAFDNPNVLYVFAAGNSAKENTIYCPANAKNIAAIGSIEQISATIAELSKVEVSIENSTGYQIAGFEFMDKIISSNAVAEKMKYYLNLSVVPYRSPFLPMNCTSWIETECEFDDFENETICTNHTRYNCSEPVIDPDFDAATYYKNKVVVLNNETRDADLDIAFCFYAKSIQQYGVEAAIYIPNVSYYKCDPLPTIPMVRLNAEDVSKIPILFEMGNISILPVAGDDNTPIPKASYRSSKGPADSGISKPDFVTPGANIFSAKSHGPETEGIVANASFADNVMGKSGTSMATPSASGLAVLVLQFFRDGFYPLIKKDSGSSYTPSSCLMRAVLINTADKPQILTPDPKSQPRTDVGFGVPCLERALGFNGLGFRVIDNETISSDSHRIFTINVDSNSADLNVTMVYLDPPLDIENEAVFFADLDLYIKSPKGIIYHGNNISDGEPLTLIERVIVDKEDIPSDGGVFEIHIVSSKYPIESTKIQFSVAVNGPFEQSNLEKNPLFLPSKNVADDDCANNCNGNGKCNKGMCVCNENFIGSFCSIPVEKIEDGGSYNQPYKHKQIKYFKLPLTNKVVNVSFDIVKSFNLGPVYFCTSFNENPGKIWNNGWECHLACPPEDPESENYPYFQNYSLKVPVEQNPSSLYFALYSGYYDSVNIGLNNILLEKVEPTTEPTSEPTKVPTSEPTSEPTKVPTSEPTSVPTSEPTSEPTSVPTSVPTTSSDITPVVTTESSSTDDGGDSSSGKKKKKKFPVLAIILVTLVVLCVVASIILVVLILWRKKETDTTSLSMQLLPNAQTSF